MPTSDFAILDNAGVAGRHIAQSDWSTHPLGPIACWPPVLRTALSIMLSSRFPSYIAWTDQLHTLFNEPYRELMAERPGSLQGAAMGALWPEVADAVVSICSRAFAGESMFFEDMSLPITRDGRTGPNFFTFSVSPIWDERGVICGVLGTVIETTEKVLALARHQEAEERYRLSLESGHMGTWSVDPDTGVTVMDNRFASLFGVDPDVAAGGASLEHFTQIIHPDDRANVIAAVSQAMQDGSAYDIDYRIVPEASPTVWVSAKGRMLMDPHSGKRRFAGVATDITERKEAVERTALEKYEASESVRAAYGLLQSVADGSGDAIASLDCDFRFTFTNESYRQNFRSVFEAEAVIGDRLHDALAHRPDDQLQAVELWGRALNGERINIETEFGDAEKDRRLWRFRFYPIYDGQGHIVGAAHNAADISDRLKAEQERERLLAELKEQDRRKDEFLAMLGHELRNPLAPISAAAALLRMRTLEPERIALTSDVISRQVAHMTNLIDDLLDVSRVTRGLVSLDMTEEPLNSVICHAVEQATPLSRVKGQHISLELAPKTTLVYGDKHRLVQVLSNILNNAVKYTPDGGHILLTTTVTADHVQIDVTDDGVGMDSAFTSRAFELFTQAERTSDRTSGGLGLGLALVKSLIELHHGTVSAYSAGIGKGSTFSLVLPYLAQREEKKRGVLFGDAAPKSESSRRIMLVDDNQDAALMLAMLLESAGHEVTVEHAAKAALAHSAKARPDVFLLDIGLPEMDGNALARRLREQPETAGAVLIALTGYGQEQDREGTRAAGFDHHLVKPVDMDYLMTLLSGVAQAKG
jgi:PAS domain S-box-containing protein